MHSLQSFTITYINLPRHTLTHTYIYTHTLTCLLTYIHIHTITHTYIHMFKHTVDTITKTSAHSCGASMNASHPTSSLGHQALCTVACCPIPGAAPRTGIVSHHGVGVKAFFIFPEILEAKGGMRTTEQSSKDALQAKCRKESSEPDGDGRWLAAPIARTSLPGKKQEATKPRKQLQDPAHFCTGPEWAPLMGRALMELPVAILQTSTATLLWSHLPTVSCLSGSASISKKAHASWGPGSGSEA